MTQAHHWQLLPCAWDIKVKGAVVQGFDVWNASWTLPHDWEEACITLMRGPKDYPEFDEHSRAASEDPLHRGPLPRNKNDPFSKWIRLKSHGLKLKGCFPDICPPDIVNKKALSRNV